MQSSGARIVKNIGALLGSQPITWGLTFLWIIFMSRYLGPSDVGKLQIATAIWIIFGVFITFGTDYLLVKEIARHPDQLSTLVVTACVVRVALFVVSCGLVALYLSFQSYDTTITYLIYAVGISILVSLLGNVVYSALQGLEMMQYFSMATVVGTSVTNGLAITFLLLGYGVYSGAIGTIISATLILVLLIRFLRRRYQFRLGVRPRGGLAMLAGGTPYLLIGLTLVAYQQIDTLILAGLVSTTVVGWYSAALRLFGTAMFLPVAVSASLLPALSRIDAGDTASQIAIVRKAFDWMMLAGVPIGLGLCVLADPLVILLFGSAFAPSGPVLAVLGIALIFTYQNILLGQFHVAMDRQKAWAVVMLIAMVGTALADFLLVPWFQEVFGNGALGAATSWLVCEFGLMVAAIALLPRGLLGRTNVANSLRIVLAGLAMVAVCYSLRSAFIMIPVLVGAATYLSLIGFMRVVPAEDLLLVKGLLRRAWSRLRQREVGSASVGEA